MKVFRCVVLVVTVRLPVSFLFFGCGNWLQIFYFWIAVFVLYYVIFGKWTIFYFLCGTPFNESFESFANKIWHSHTSNLVEFIFNFIHINLLFCIWLLKVNLLEIMFKMNLLRFKIYILHCLLIQLISYHVTFIFS